jgi:hypothetical protein
MKRVEVELVEGRLGAPQAVHSGAASPAYVLFASVLYFIGLLFGSCMLISCPASLASNLIAILVTDKPIPLMTINAPLLSMICNLPLLPRYEAGASAMSAFHLIPLCHCATPDESTREVV